MKEVLTDRVVNLIDKLDEAQDGIPIEIIVDEANVRQLKDMEDSLTKIITTIKEIKSEEDGR